MISYFNKGAPPPEPPLQITPGSDPLVEAVSSFNKMLDSDPTKERLTFFKEENEKSRKQELEIFKLQLQSQLQMQMLSKICEVAFNLC